MNRLNMPGRRADRVQDGLPGHPVSAQTQVEQQNFEIRKNVLKYDEVLNKQRTVIYDERRRVLAGEDMQEQIEHMIERRRHRATSTARRPRATPRTGTSTSSGRRCGTLYPVSLTVEEVIEGRRRRATT